MYQEIKNLAEEALRLQNKNAMDEAFKQIIAICDDAATTAIKHAAAEVDAQPVVHDYHAPNENPAAHNGVSGNRAST